MAAPRRIDLDIPERIVKLCRAFRAAGHQLVVVGGGIRDLLLGLQPSSRWDLATSASPRQVRKVCPAARADTVSHTDLTLLLVEFQRLALEITPFRESHLFERIGGGMEYDAVAATLEQDLAGRDFTINSMAYDPLDRILYDPHDGQVDLALRFVRSLPDPPARFRRDPVRILRGIRIAESLGFEVEPGTLAAMRGACGEAEFPPYRTYRELTRILESGRPAWCLERIEEIGAVGRILPPLEPCLTLADPVQPTRTVWGIMLHALWLMDRAPAPIGWSFLVGARILALWLASGDPERQRKLDPGDARAQRVALQALGDFERHFPVREQEEERPSDGPGLPGHWNRISFAGTALEIVAYPQDEHRLRTQFHALLHRREERALEFPDTSLGVFWAEARSDPS